MVYASKTAKRPPESRSRDIVVTEICKESPKNASGAGRKHGTGLKITLGRLCGLHLAGTLNHAAGSFAADLDPTRLEGFGHFALKVDRQEAVGQ